MSHAFETYKPVASNEESTYNENRNNCDCFKEKCTKFCSMIRFPIFKPDDPYLIAWQIFILIILVYSLLEIPYILAFQIEFHLKDGWFIFGFIIDMILICDILVNFRTAYVDKFDRLRIIVDPISIAKRYAKTWFIVDLLSSFPFAFIILNANNNDDFFAVALRYLALFRILKLLRILRLVKVYGVFHEFNYEMSQAQTSILRLIKVIACMLLTAHFFACIWYAVGYHTYRNGMNSWIEIIIENEDFDKGVFVRYSYAFYWAIVTLFTTGYGDITANNIYEQWAASIGIILGSCLFAYFIAVLTTELTEDLKHQNDAERIEKSLTFCTHYDLPHHIRRAVMIHANYFNKTNYPFDPSFVMDSLPNYLQKDIKKHLRRKRLRDLDIFKDLPHSIVGQIALKMKRKSCGENKTLYAKNDIATKMFIQHTGESILVDENNKTINRFRRGDVIGENAIVSDKRQYTVKCSTYSEFYVLKVQDIIDILEKNYKETEADKHWQAIKQMIQHTSWSDSDSLRGQHQRRCVRLESITNLGAAYVQRSARDVAKDVVEKVMSSDHSDDSDNDEEEKEEPPPLQRQKATKSKSKSKGHKHRFPIHLRSNNSAVRHRQILQHKRGVSLPFYAQDGVSEDDFNVDKKTLYDKRLLTKNEGMEILDEYHDGKDVNEGSKNYEVEDEFDDEEDEDDVGDVDGEHEDEDDDEEEDEEEEDENEQVMKPLNINGNCKK